MSVRTAPRSRLETRATVLEAVLRSKGLLRQEIAAEARLTEASVSRILAELRSEGVIEEKRIPAPYIGGPTGKITLSKDIHVLGIELANDRLSLGLGDLAGGADYIERQPVGPGMDQAAFERLFADALQEVVSWAAERGRTLRQAALSLPGLMPAPGGEGDETNVILPWDMVRLRGFVSRALGDVPLAMTNTVIAQAAFHRYRRGQSYPPVGDHLFVFVGNGLAGVMVNEGAPVDTFRPFELGHMIIERGGAVCRCGHRGCLEAYTSLKAVSALVGLPADEILRRGDGFLDPQAVGNAQRQVLRERLRLLGVGIGNALNLAWLPSVVLCGWPSLMAAEARAEIEAGIAESLLGGAGAWRPQLDFVAPSIGNDPRGALAFAAHAFVQGGGQQSSLAMAEAAEN